VTVSRFPVSETEGLENAESLLFNKAGPPVPFSRFWQVFRKRTPLIGFLQWEGEKIEGKGKNSAIPLTFLLFPFPLLLKKPPGGAIFRGATN